MTGTLDVYRDAQPKAYVIYNIEHLDPPRRSIDFGERLGVQIFVRKRELADLFGRYDVESDRLVMTLPSDVRKANRNIPDALKSTPSNGADLVTFERVRPPTPARLFTPGIRMVADWVTGGTGVFRLDGWEYRVTPDWTLTGVNAQRKLQFTARLDGSITFRTTR
jgi:hypothetical protein